MARTLQTEFAPAERMPIEIVHRQSEALRSIPWTETFLNSGSDYVLILNTARQIVFHSRNFKSLAPAGQADRLLGLRTGEAIACERSDKCAWGCGGTEECLQCGALLAIQTALEGVRCAQECRVLRVADGTVQAMDLLVTATPFDHNGERFCVCSFSDIGHRKRREAIEHAFFENLMNSAGGLEQLMQVLRQEVPPHLRANLQTAASAFRDMVEEVQSYRDLAAAERGELAVHCAPEDARDLLTCAVEDCRQRGLAPAVDIAFIHRQQRIELVTDRVLLCRTLGFILRNAVEAAGGGARISVGCDPVGEHVRFWVHNPGTMSRDVQLQVFNRSFSTKGQGRGLGTYTARLLAERYLGGKVDFHTSPAEGTTFLIEVPVAGPKPAAA